MKEGFFMKIINKNENFGGKIIFQGETLADCLASMQRHIRSCKYIVNYDNLLPDVDYEVATECLGCERIIGHEIKMSNIQTNICSDCEAKIMNLKAGY